MKSWYPQKKNWLNGREAIMRQKWKLKSKSVDEKEILEITTDKVPGPVEIPSELLRLEEDNIMLLVDFILSINEKR